MDSRPTDEVLLLAVAERDMGAFHTLYERLPGHSPGSIGLWDCSAGILFSGDAAYDGPLLDELGDSDIGQSCGTSRSSDRLPGRRG